MDNRYSLELNVNSLDDARIGYKKQSPTEQDARVGTEDPVYIEKGFDTHDSVRKFLIASATDHINAAIASIGSPFEGVDYKSKDSLLMDNSPRFIGLTMNLIDTENLDLVIEMLHKADAENDTAYVKPVKKSGPIVAFTYTVRNSEYEVCRLGTLGYKKLMIFRAVTPRFSKAVYDWWFQVIEQDRLDIYPLILGENTTVDSFVYEDTQTTHEWLPPVMRFVFPDKLSARSLIKPWMYLRNEFDSWFVRSCFVRSCMSKSSYRSNVLVGRLWEDFKALFFGNTGTYFELIPGMDEPVFDSPFNINVGEL